MHQQHFALKREQYMLRRTDQIFQHLVAFCSSGHLLNVWSFYSNIFEFSKPKNLFDMPQISPGNLLLIHNYQRPFLPSQNPSEPDRIDRQLASERKYTLFDTGSNIYRWISIM